MAACCDAELLTRVTQVVRLNHNLEGVLVSLWFWKREARALEGRRVSSKSPSRFRDGDEEVAGRNGRNWFSPDEGSLIFLEGKSMIFYKKRKQDKMN